MLAKPHVLCFVGGVWAIACRVRSIYTPDVLGSLHVRPSTQMGTARPSVILIPSIVNKGGKSDEEGGK